MAERKHFKHDAESDLGVGTAFLEVTDGWPSRQVEVYGETWLWGDEDHPDNLADQPLDVLDLGAEHEIAQGEFEQAWTQALTRSSGE